MEFLQEITNIGGLYQDILEIDFLHDAVKVIYSVHPWAESGKTYTWSALWQKYGSWISPKDLPLLEANLSETAVQYHLQGDETAVFAALCGFPGEEARYMEFGITRLSCKMPSKILLVIRCIHQQMQRREIIEHYIKNSCEYLVCVDPAQDQYVTYFASKGVSQPFEQKGCYTKDIAAYVCCNVVWEDRKQCLQEMQPAIMIKNLRHQNEYSFFIGIEEPEVGYKRKKISYFYEDSRREKILMMRTDVTQMYKETQKKENELQQAVKEAQRDSLTGLYNYKFMMQYISQSIKKQETGMAAVLFMDLDNFKQINDTLGHLQGDYLLKLTAEVFVSVFHNKGIAGRVGGDEFLIFLPAAVSQDEVEGLAGSLCRAISALSQLIRMPVSCSIGLSFFPKQGKTYHTLIQKADVALYYAKEQGKNRYAVFSKSISSERGVSSMFSSIDSV